MNTLIIIFCLIVCVMAQNNTSKDHFLIAEAALGGMIPTSLIIMLAALVRILQLYKQRKAKQKPLESYV